MQETPISNTNNGKRRGGKMVGATPEPIGDERPALMYHTKGLIEWFAKTFVNKGIIQCYNGFELGQLRNNSTKEVIMGYVRVLLEANETVPIAANNNWIHTLVGATSRYEIKKLSKTLPQAFDQYLLNLSVGIGFAKKEENWVDIKTMMRKGILEGRKLNGEPEDFNF